MQNTKKPFFSILIPAHNEEENVLPTCQQILQKFKEEQIDDFEILLINDHSQDQTEKKLQELCNTDFHIRYLNNELPGGFGYALRYGLQHFNGEAVCIVMADLSDSPSDIVNYYRHLKKGHTCVFGSRFIKGSKVIDYPQPKLAINRIANWMIKILFGLKHNDLTNAFKAYRKEVIWAIQPLESKHFDLTVELSLKTVVLGFDYATVPISWQNRTKGVSKLKIKEVGGRYGKVIFSVFLKKFFGISLK